MQQIQLWTIDDIFQRIQLTKPLLACWNANAHPEQVALQRYLDKIEQELHPLPQAAGLSLHMQIDVKEPEHLLYHHDLDNYLYPVVHRLGASRFRLVSAIKCVGRGSFLQIGSTKPEIILPEKEAWSYFQHDTAGVSLEKPEWKSSIRDALKAQQFHLSQSGAIELQLVWECSSRRNWTSLWKPTIDSMGPVLGEPYPSRQFYPNDDRIVSLALHLRTDDSIEWSVRIGMMLRPLSASL
jgi:hypothetical protein